MAAVWRSRHWVCSLAPNITQQNFDRFAGNLSLLRAGHNDMPEQFLYFAYGSNMSTRRLRARTPSAQPLGTARLPGYRLAWHKLGRDGSAKCDIEPTGQAQDSVWGVLFQIVEEERADLDLAEGLGQGYGYKIASVLAATGSIKAGMYYATHIDASRQPFDWYLAFVLSGAREHGLPATYLHDLQTITAAIDPDVTRRQQNFAILQNG
ncbi:MAG: gamma-glutamylcyclotransferase family protein [Cyanobacteria bacterium J06641_5]